MNGYLPKTELELNLPSVVQDIPRAVHDEVERARDIAMEVKVTMDAKLAAARRRQLEYYNMNRCDVTFKVGYRVWFYRPARGVASVTKLSLP